ncbi:MAG: uroporphyrinogen decarboxylase [Burkholderiales bacterium]|nr:uroporphyrinogen decarboxylase [Burkholderiales bacterium]
MNRIERVQAALRGEPVDRPPYAFWTHLPGIDLDPLRLAQETAAFQARYDLDFIKSMPNGFYCVEDWGAACDYSDIARGGVARTVRAAVCAIDDWARLERVSASTGAYGRELRHLRELVRRVGPDVPVLATVFSPLTTAGKLSQEAHRSHLRQSPAAVLAGIEVIAEVTCAFVREAIGCGCSGMFFATQDATHAAFSEADYRRFGEPYDRQVLQAAKTAGAWFNVLHAHGEDVLFDLLKDYDITALNWHIGETAPSIEAYRRGGGKRPIVGGLQRGHLTRGDRAAIAADIARSIDQTHGRGILIAPACVIRHPVDEATLKWTAAQICNYGAGAADAS